MKAIEIIKHFEGLSLKPYTCPAGYQTIGYGHLITKNETFGTITEQEAEKLLIKDINRVTYHVRKLITPILNDNQLSAIISFTYNLGAASLQRSSLRQKINREEHDLVPEELMKWVYAKGRKLPGLVRRRECEAILYTSNM